MNTTWVYKVLLRKPKKNNVLQKYQAYIKVGFKHPCDPLLPPTIAKQDGTCEIPIALATRHVKVPPNSFVSRSWTKMYLEEAAHITLQGRNMIASSEMCEDIVSPVLIRNITLCSFYPNKPHTRPKQTRKKRQTNSKGLY